jgi:hypothetical protein
MRDRYRYTTSMLNRHIVSHSPLPLALSDTRYPLQQYLPRPFAIGLTQAFLLATAPLYLSLFVFAGPAWQRNNTTSPLPPFLTLPIPSFYPK